MPQDLFETDVIKIRDRLAQHLVQAPDRVKMTMAAERTQQVLEDMIAIEVRRYVHHVRTAMAAVRIDRDRVAVQLRDHAADELVHTIQLAERVVQLGGSTDFDAVTVIKHAHVVQPVSDRMDLPQMLAEDLDVEPVVITCCHRIGRRLDSRDLETRRLMTSIEAETIKHVGGLTQLLRQIQP